MSERFTAQERRDMQDCAFFVQTMIHLRGVNPENRRAYLKAADRLMKSAREDAYDALNAEIG